MSGAYGWMIDQGRDNDDYWRDYEDWQDGGYQKTVRCKRCGARNLIWEDVAVDTLHKHWQLLTNAGKVHYCPQVTADDFNVVVDDFSDLA